MCDCEEDGLKQQKPHRVPSLSIKSRPQFTHQKPFGLLLDTVKVGQESGGETRSKGAWVGLKPGTDSNPAGWDALSQMACGCPLSALSQTSAHERQKFNWKNIDWSDES